MRRVVRHRPDGALTEALVVSIIAIAAACLASSAAFAAGPAGGDGKAIFLAQKCNLCHSISAAGIEAIVKSPAMRGPDLTGVVAEKGADWTAKFLRHQVDLDGKRHKKELTASDQDVQTLIGWLAEQKKAAK